MGEKHEKNKNEQKETGRPDNLRENCDAWEEKRGRGRAQKKREGERKKTNREQKNMDDSNAIKLVLKTEEKKSKKGYKKG